MIMAVDMAQAQALRFKEILRENIERLVGDSETTDAIMTLCETVGKMASVNEKSRAILMEAADQKGNSYDTLKDMAKWLLKESNDLNEFHWNVDKNSKHELLDEAYTLGRDIGDKLAEAYIAIMDKPTDTPPSDEEVLNRLKTLQRRMQEAVSKNSKFSEGVKNYFADFDEKITSIIYKWSRFSA
jgi:DNA-binding ferritin-like protein